MVHAMVVRFSYMWFMESATVSLIRQILLLTLDVQRPKSFQLQGAPLTPRPGALPLDPAGGSAPRPPLKARATALAIIPPRFSDFPPDLGVLELCLHYKPYCYSHSHSHGIPMEIPLPWDFSLPSFHKHIVSATGLATDRLHCADHAHDDRKLYLTKGTWSSEPDSSTQLITSWRDLICSGSGVSVTISTASHTLTTKQLHFLSLYQSVVTWKTQKFAKCLERNFQFANVKYELWKTLDICKTLLQTFCVLHIDTALHPPPSSLFTKNHLRQ